MCGLIAITSPSGSFFPLEKSLLSIKHRGPDDEGEYVSENRECHLGQVRLSILDLNITGHQPMFDQSGQFAICYNGEVYNYLDLKKELETKHGRIHWKSTTDTEVILEGVAREGLNFFSKLNGIFAIALYDKKQNQLHILRDPIGIKPLYFTQQHGSFFFCSELKGLTCLPMIKKTICIQSLADQLAFMYIPEPNTPFNEIFKVEPGFCTTYSAGRIVNSVNLFEHLINPMSFASEKDMIDQFYTKFQAAVKRQLISDVPVSLMLSGGLDSSAIAHSIISQGASINSAYTISIDKSDRALDRQSDDLYYAELVAKKLGLNLQVIPAKVEFTQLIPQLSKFFEDGISDPAALNAYLICKAARENGVKVMLSGQGADEYLAGYRRYYAESFIQNFPSFLKSSTAFIGSLIPESVPGKLNATARKTKRLFSLVNQNPSERMLGLYTWNTPKKIKQLFINGGEINIGQDLLNLFSKYHDLPPLEAMMRVDNLYDLRSLNLNYTDKMSMAVGVESRVPFLDFELVRLMNALPLKMKLNRGVAKYILKKAMEPNLPHEVIYREKAGFSLPIRSWIQKDSYMLHYLNEDTIRRQGIFNGYEVQKMYKNQIEGKQDNANTLFTLFCIQVWLESQGLKN